ncbi:MAG: prolyl oligopeptidase family serine peptidase, partial [Burkholderiales bacterium]|nr:prolyl oligopeptidase family serine peptidase [Burkholderiales bacterium]
LAGKGKYVKLTWDRGQTQAAFLSDRDDAVAKVPAFKLYHWARGTPGAKERVSPGTGGFPTGMTLSDKGDKNTLAFSRDGKKLYVPVAPPGKPPRAPDSGPNDHDKVIADLWRWNDDLVQPMQKIRAVQERNRSYRGAFDLETSAYAQLASESLRTVSLSDDGKRAIGFDDRAYRRMVDYDANYADVYVVNAATGERTLVQKKQRSNTNLTQNDWSPDGKWLGYFQDKHWYALNTADGTSKNLTRALGVAVHNQQHDMPAPPGAYGTGGWTSDSTSLLIYDRFDVWQVFVDGRKAQNLTRGEGRKSAIRLRVQRIEPVDEDDDERGIDAKKPLVLRGESDETRASGFYKTTFGSTVPPQRLIWADKNLRYVGRARDADVLLVTGSRFDTFPDLNTADSNFANVTSVSEVGKQMVPFTWGTSELMAFTNAKGAPLKASVYKPDNFDTKKKYPLMVYIYERVSQNVNNFINPAPSNGLNAALYVSNGYVVLMPDIAYTTGEPGKSALDAVLPAIDKLVKQGFIDENAIGIQGHSWGGYQIAWMVTQTNRFRAAEAGAPVGNMTSAYSGIRWGSGLPRQFQYEQLQSRIGKSLQEAPQLYLANSPVFHVKKVQTPLLLLANDADDAVPWYQGIEMFLALRRYQKEAYLFNYNGQLHNLRRRADQKDLALRMHQFFDHFLKGSAKPAWMEKGISYLDREDEKEQFGKVQGAAAEGAK